MKTAKSRKSSRSRKPRPRRKTSPPRVGPSVQIKFIDLFAGIGGIRLGVERAARRRGVDARCVFTCEWDTFAQQTYRQNFGNEPIAGDINQVDVGSIPDHDLLLAGFPCQPFSIAGVSKKRSLGRRHGFEDETQGNLFFKIREIIDEKRPKAFLLENVKHLLRHDRGNTFAVIRRILQDELKYDLHVHVLDAARLVPQHRERVFLVGFREPRDFKPPVLPRTGPTLAKILQKGRVDPKYTLSDHLWTYLKQYAAKHRAQGNGFGYGLFGPDDVARTLSARYHKDGSEILIHQNRKNPRRLTPRECARLMGFPPRFKFSVSDTRAYRQFGNSVVVPLVAKVACQLFEALKGPVVERPAQPAAAVPSDQAELSLSA